MKTIITTLPIYNKLSKQCYERSKHAINGAMITIVTPRHRLPSFQWIDGTDGAATISKVELCDKTYTGAEESVATTWLSALGFDTFTNPSGLEIDPAINNAGVCSAGSSVFTTVKGTQIRVIGTLVRDSAGGTEPGLLMSGLPATITPLVSGANSIILTSIFDGTNQVLIYKNGATEYHFTGVSIKKITGALNITSWFSTLPTLVHDYFSYGGDTLNYLMPTGEYYLKFTMDNGHIYYSEWFEVDCVYENLLTDPDNELADYDTIVITGTTISSAINVAGTANMLSNRFDVVKDEVLTLICYFTKNSGQLPIVLLSDSGVPKSNGVDFVAGLNVITLTATATGSWSLHIYNTDAADFSTSEILLMRGYSDKYLTLNFHNDCDLGDFYYHGGFDQSIWFKSEAMETLFPQEEEGIKNGEGRVIKTFIRQEKKYIARTNVMPDYMVDVFNRIKLHDFVELIDLVGDVHNVYNLEVAHEWLFDDKYYAKIDLTFDNI
jgi:hypothetical protein